MADNCTFADAFYFVDAVFNFAGVDIFPVHDDEVFDAVYDVNVLVIIHVGQVAGSKPAVFGDDFLCFFRFVPVAFHHVDATNHEFTDGSWFVRTFFIGLDISFHARDSRAAGQIFRFRAGENADNRRCFSETISFLYRMMETGVECLSYRLRNRCATGNKGVYSLHHRRISSASQKVIHRRYHERDSDGIFNNSIDDFRRILRTEDDHGGMVEKTAVHYSGQTIAVEHR